MSETVPEFKDLSSFRAWFLSNPGSLGLELVATIDENRVVVKRGTAPRPTTVRSTTSATVPSCSAVFVNCISRTWAPDASATSLGRLLDLCWTLGGPQSGATLAVAGRCYVGFARAMNFSISASLVENDVTRRASTWPAGTVVGSVRSV